jgi:hypothetical protein
MQRAWSIAGLLVAAAAAIFLAVRMQDARTVVPGNQPVTMDQVRQQLEADGWSNIQLTRHGRFIRAVMTRNGKEQTIDVEASTGLLRISDDDDPVTDEDK